MDFVNAMVWLDAVFFRLWAIVAIFLVIHFALSIVTGRAKKSFIDGQWPEHDSVPPPLPKFLHAQHMFMMILLALTGMWIHFPQSSPFPKAAMQWVHYFAMIVVTINLVWRIGYAFWSDNADWKEFRIQKKDALTLGGVLKYYGYMSNNKPHVAKYNVAQKGSYIFFLVLMFSQAFTGFALLDNVTSLKMSFFGLTPQMLLVGWWLGLATGRTVASAAVLAAPWIRVAHYAINWLFIIMTTVHVYLSATIDVPVTLDFFGLKKLELKPHADHGDHAEPATMAVGAK